MSDDGDEFALIARHFAPLARTPAARGLLDDVALLENAGTLVVTTDTVIEGVHFLPDDPIDLVAQKALRVNLSDIAAKGATPLAYLVALQWPANRPARQIATFADGLARDQASFGCVLIGGDTTATPGPLAITVTMFGRPAAARTPARADARPGDDVWVTGTIGDGVLGLAACRGDLAGLDGAHRYYLAARYRTPTPRVGFAPAVGRLAHASMDVSDGLLGDAAKIAAASAVRIEIGADALPFSAAAMEWLALQPDRAVAIARLANGGDDYEILFSATPRARPALTEAADDIGLRLTRIGRVVVGAGLDAGGLTVGGHVHRLGA